MSGDPVVLARFADVRQAEFLRSILAGSGIESFIDVPYTSNLFPHYMLNDGGVALWVRPSDLGRATELMEQAGGEIEWPEFPGDGEAD